MATLRPRGPDARFRAQDVLGCVLQTPNMTYAPAAIHIQMCEACLNDHSLDNFQLARYHELVAFQCVSWVCSSA